MKARITVPLLLALAVGIAFIATLAMMLFNFSSSMDRVDTVVEHRFSSMIGGLEDDVIRLSPGESKTFKYELDQSRDDTGLMTGFIQLVRINGTGVSSVEVEIGDSSVPSYYHQLHLSDGQLKQIEFIIPRSGSVTFKNEGDRTEEMMLNLQLTYFAILDSKANVTLPADSQ